VQPTGADLFGVTFLSPTNGYAVGDAGTILHFDGSGWHADRGGQLAGRAALYAVTKVGGGVVAVGANGVVLANPTGDPDSGWRKLNLPSTMTPNPAFYGVGGLPDGRMVVGGTNSALITGDINGPLSLFPAPAEGNFMDVKARALPGGRIELFASLAASTTNTKFSGSMPVALQSWMMHFDGDRWQDMDHAHRITVDPSHARAAVRDPVYAIALDPSGGPNGWAVGGEPANATDGAENQE